MQFPLLSLLVAGPRPISSQFSELSRSIRTITICWVWNVLKIPYFLDRWMPMGCSSSCTIFEAFSNSLEWLAKHFLGVSGILQVLQFFLFIAESQSKCRSDLSKFWSLCDYLGVPIPHEKTERLVTTLQFAGITLNAINMETSLPEVTLQKCRELLTDFHKCQKVTLRELQSFKGLLNFTCSVVLPGRGFLRRLVDLTKGVRYPHHRIPLSKACCRIYQFGFLEHFNRRTFFLDKNWLSHVPLKLYTDTAGSKD